MDGRSRDVPCLFRRQIGNGGGDVVIVRADDGPEGFPAFLARVKAAVPPVAALYIASLILGLCFAGLLFLAVARRMVGDEPS